MHQLCSKERAESSMRNIRSNYYLTLCGMNRLTLRYIIPVPRDFEFGFPSQILSSVFIGKLARLTITSILIHLTILPSF
jgi:hypothetical protein